MEEIEKEGTPVPMLEDSVHVERMATGNATPGEPGRGELPCYGWSDMPGVAQNEGPRGGLGGVPVMFQASICCEDRASLLIDIINAAQVSYTSGGG